MARFKQKLIGAILLAGATLFPLKAQERVIMDPFPLPYSTELAIDHNYPELSSLEKITYLEDKFEQDTSTIYISRNKDALCGNWVGQMWTNFDGDSTLIPAEIPFEYYYTENGKENIQTFNVGFSLVANPPHAVDGFVIEDSLENINSFYTYDNSRGKRIYLDSLEKNIDLGYEIDTSKLVSISHITGFGSEGFPKTSTMLKFKYINGNLKLIYKDPSVVLTNPALDKEKPITEYSFTDTITNNPENLILNYNFHDGEYLETKNYYFGAELQPYDFYSGHFLDSGFFQIDNQDKIDFDFSRQRGLIRIPIYNQSGEIPLDKSEGKHQVIAHITEYSKNTTIDTINYEIDKTAPEITASINHIEGTDSAEVAINVSETNPDYARYSYNGSDWNYFSSDTLFKEELNKGENILNVEAKDKATNYSGKEEKLHFIPDAIEKKTLENYFKTYPNPVTDNVNFEFYLNKPQNLKFSVYDVAGRELGKTLIEGNQGENKVSYDFSEYKSGIYIYKLGEKTGKIIKR